MKITVVQNNPAFLQPSQNLKKIDVLLRRVKSDLIVLPEVWTVGWKPSLFKESAEDLKSETATFLSDLAKKHNVSKNNLL